MTKPKPPKVRLAVSGSPSPEVFNFYQIISVLSGLYIKAGNREDVADYKLGWDFASDSLLGQVGDAYDLWQLAQKSSADGIPVADDLALVGRTARFALRIVSFEEQLSMWSPVSRWARILCLLELKLDRLSGQLADHNPYIADKMKIMMEVSARRKSSMAMIEAAAIREENSLKNGFAIPVAL